MNIEEIETENGYITFEDSHEYVEIIERTSNRKRIGSIDIFYADIPDLIARLQQLIS